MNLIMVSMRNEILASALLLSAATSCGSESDPGPRLDVEAAPFDIVPDSEDLESSPLMWVETTNGGRCNIDMRHVLDGYVVVETLDSAGGTACDEGDKIVQSSLPENHDAYLDDLRKEWEDFLLNALQEIVDGSSEEHYTYIGEHQWVDRIGAIEEDEAGEIWISLFGGYETWGTRRKELTALPYGPDACSIGISRSSDRNANREIMIVGEVSYQGTPKAIGIVIDHDTLGAPCSLGDVILVEMYGVDGLYPESVPLEPDEVVTI